MPEYVNSTVHHELLTNSDLVDRAYSPQDTGAVSVGLQFFRASMPIIAATFASTTIRWLPESRLIVSRLKSWTKELTCQTFIGAIPPHRQVEVQCDRNKAPIDGNCTFRYTREGRSSV